MVLTREAGTLTFASGTLVFLNPVGGRIMGAAFKGRGTFVFSPRTEVERGQLARQKKDSSVTVDFVEAVLLFSDTTAAEVEHRAAFADGVPSPVDRGRIGQVLDYLGDDHDHSIDPAVLLDLLTAAPGGLFYAHLVPVSGSPVMFLVTPRQHDGVQFRERERTSLASGYSAATVQEAASAAPGMAGDRSGDAVVRHYDLDISLPNTGTGDIGFSASARMIIAADQPVGPWIAFAVFPNFTVDSASWGDGTAAVVEKKKDSPYLWVRLPAALPAGATAELRLAYHGDLIDRFGDFFYIKGSTAW